MPLFLVQYRKAQHNHPESMLQLSGAHYRLFSDPLGKSTHFLGLAIAPEKQTLNKKPKEPRNNKEVGLRFRTSGGVFRIVGWLEVQDVG